MDFQYLKSEALIQPRLTAEFSFWNWLYTYEVLPFNMQPQTQSNWCWAATSVSVSKFYSFLSPWTQCKVASAELGQTCCTTPVPGACNVPWYLDKALTRTNNFVSIQGGTVPWSRIKQELDNGLVVGTRIGWSGGGGHFMVIHGVSRIGSREYLHIDDPIYKKSVLLYSQYATNYQGSGTWTHTYFTKKYFYFMWFKELLYKQELLKPIPELRPLINIYDKAFTAKKDEPQGTYTIPHHSYVIGLNEINERFALPDAPRSLRVIEVAHERPVALYEVGLNEQNPEFIQMQVSPEYFKEMDEGLGRLKSFAEREKELGEIRMIKVPALNIEAFWMHYDNKEKDMIVPVKRFENEQTIDWSKAYDEQEFLRLLQELSRRVNTQDDLLGA
jgi:hypothetical protein